MPLFEFHDQPWFPSYLRDYVTDGLQSAMSLGGIYRSIAARLNGAFQACKASRVVDLCSGGSGPWPWLHESLRDSHGHLAEICLTDLYPNTPAFERIQQESHGTITYWPESVDATKVPSELAGFRTMFSSFHHFPKQDAIGILRNAVANRQGIGVFEAARRHPLTFALNFLVLPGSFVTTPFIRPFRASRFFWTYLLPVIPFVLFYDGLVSCWRAYSTTQLSEMIASLNAEGYVWEVGEEPHGFFTVTYLLGYPVK
jgi:hypothetical protein